MKLYKTNQLIIEGERDNIREIKKEIEREM